MMKSMGRRLVALAAHGLASMAQPTVQDADFTRALAQAAEQRRRMKRTRNGRRFLSRVDAGLFRLGVVNGRVAIQPRVKLVGGKGLCV